MNLSSKCYYGLRALLDLAVNVGRPTVKISEIAARRRIPPRFLEMILAQLKQGGFVESRRGADGGYRLARAPDKIAVGEVIRFIDGPNDVVDCVGQGRDKPCGSECDCAFFNLWKRTRDAISGVLDTTTLANLIEQDRSRDARASADWSI